jgi:hypothetical protein
MLVSIMRNLSLMTFIILALSFSSVAQKSAIVDVPMIFYGTRPAIEVTANDKPGFLFLIDTGAQGMARADVSLVQRLRLPSVGQSTASDISGTNPVNLNEVRFDTLSIGSFSFRQVTALSRNYNTVSYLPNIDGILGFELFSDYLLTLDYPKKRVRIEKGELPKPDGARILSFESQDGVPFIEIGVGSLKAKALIDTGNIRGIEFPSSLVKKLPLASYRRVIGKGGSISNEFEISEVRLQDTISVGQYLFPEPTITFTDIYSDVNIGSTMLSEFAITFDQKNRRVRFVKKQKVRAKK